MATDKEKKERIARIEKVCSAINKSKWGGDNNDAVSYLGNKKIIPVERFSAGIACLNDALGGGYPVGRVIEIFGPEASGKTTCCYHAIAEFQSKYPDSDIAIIDTEHSMDMEYAKKIGVNPEFLLVHQPDTGEQALNNLIEFVKFGVKLIIVDSVAGLTPMDDYEKDVGETTVATRARLMSQSLGKISTIASKNKATVIFTNQIREKIGVVWGKNTTTPGGRALRFFSSVRMEIKRIGSEKDGEEIVGATTRVEVVKNKVAVPYKKTDFVITFGVGFNVAASLLDTALSKGVIKKAGAWYSYGENRIGQGKANAIQYLLDNKEVRMEIEANFKDIKAPAQVSIEEEEIVDVPQEQEVEDLSEGEV